MQIKSIIIKNFLRHDSSKLELPEHGVVLITGKNGHGKSSFIEAASFAGWGKSLRNTPVYRPDQKAVCQLETYDNLSIKRTRKNRKQSIEWEKPGQDTTYDTVTKSQRALEDIVGPHDIWSKACVFSSSDAESFTTATDSQRKKLLETVVGLDKFDEALKSCKEDISVLNAKLEKLKMSIRSDELLLEEKKKRLESLNQSFTEESVEVSLVDVESLNEKLKAARQELAEKTKEKSKRETKLQELRTIASNEKDKLKRVSMDTCPSCGQDIPEELKASIQEEVDTKLASLREDYSRLDTSAKSLKKDIDEINHTLGLLSSSLMEANKSRAVSADIARRREKAQESLASLKNEIIDIEGSGEKDRAALSALESELAELEIVKKALGTKGIRAHLLDQVLDDIENLANIWLSKMSDGVKVELLSYTEKKSGGTSDSISLNVHGWGMGYGYLACSAGERRRIDIAIMLAISEVAKGSMNYSNSTLFFDEVFDALDDDGVESVKDLLSELSEDRCVVLISHSDRLKLIGVSKHINIHEGKILSV